MPFWRSIPPRLRAARALSRSDRGLILQAWLLLLAADLALRALPSRRVMAMAARRRGSDGAAEETGETIARLSRLVDAAARHHLYPMLCLRRALVLQWLLGRRGIATDLRLGVRREADGVTAHAWLERDGRPVGGTEETAGFAPLGPGLG